MWYGSSMNIEDEDFEDRLFDLMWAIARDENLDWDRHRGLIHEKALKKIESEA